MADDGTSTQAADADPPEAAAATPAPGPAPAPRRRLRQGDRLTSSQNLAALRAELTPEGGVPRTAAGSSGAASAGSGSARVAAATPAVALDSGDPLVGTTIDGKYKVLAPLGSGGMARVYKAWHSVLAKEFAIKFIIPEANDSARFREHFFREARIAMGLVHKHLVQVREFGETADGRFYILMDYCPGRTLGRVLRDDGPLEPARALHVVGQVLEAIAEAHAHGIVHRDLKPDNIIIDEESDHHARVLDFGLAKAMGADEAERKVGVLVGTPRYMSPEQAAAETCDHRADIYAVGLVLYEALSGRLPFEGATATELIQRRLSDEPAPLSARVPGLELPRGLEEVVMKALARERVARWQTADELRDALLRVLGGGEQPAAPRTTTTDFELRGPLDAPLRDLGRAHRVRHKRLDRDGVVWMIDGAPRPDGKGRFEAALALAGRVDHPALAHVLDHGVEGDGRMFAFTGWAAGTPLSERPPTSGPVAPEEVARLALPLVDALERAHGYGVTHGALDPRLIVVGASGPVLHGLGVLSAARGEPGDPRDDVRALALLILGLFAGAPGVDPDETRRRGLAGAPGAVKVVLEAASGADVAYPDAAAFGAALRRHAPFAPPAPPETTPAPAAAAPLPPAPAPARGVPIAVALVVGVVAVVVALAAFVGRGDPPPATVTTTPPPPPVAQVEPRVEDPVRTEVDPAGQRLGDDGLRQQVADARRACVEAAAERLAATELREADAAWEAAREERGQALAEQAASAARRYDAVARLAAGRADLVLRAERVAVVSAEAAALRAQAVELLVDATDPQGLAALDDALARAGAASAAAPAAAAVALDRLDPAREEWTAVEAAWTGARDAAARLVEAARASDPRALAARARERALASGAQELAPGPFADAEQAWEAARALQGPAAARAAADAQAGFTTAEELAGARRALGVRLEQAAALVREAEALKAEARRDVADVHVPAAYAAADKLLADAARRNAAARAVGVAALDDPASEVEACADLAQRARDAYQAVARRAHDVNGLKTRLHRFSNAMVHRRSAEVFDCYADPSVDRVFLGNLLAKCEALRFRVGEPTIDGDDAHVSVVDFSYVDPARSERVVLRGMRLQLRRVDDDWRVLNLRRE